MDQELREYLDKQFKSIDERFRSVDEHFVGVDGRLGGMDKRFEGIETRLGGIDKRLEGVETGVRHNGVLIEALKGEIQLVAESVANVASDLKGFKGEMAQELKDVGATMDLHDSELDRRLKKLEKPRRSPQPPSARKRPSPKAASSR